MAATVERKSWTTWAPLVIFVPIQAALLFYHLDLLPTWGDEWHTLRCTTQPVTDMLHDLQVDMHPPLYFLLARYWVRLPWPGSQIVQIRALSVVFILIALAVMERLWLRHLDRASRWWFYALWAFSPCLLFYARMGRSYSMQLLFGCIGLHLAWKFIRTPTSWRCGVGYTVGAVLLLYTHYLPGIALIAAVTLLLVWKTLRQQTAGPLVSVALANLLITIAFAPWLHACAEAIGRVVGGERYWLVKSFLLETFVKLSYWFVSFTFGEALQLWQVGASIVLAPGVLFLLWRTTRDTPSWLPLVLATAIIGYIGAADHVSFAFIPARLLFVLPFFLLLLVCGRRTAPLFGTIVCAGLLCVSLGSIHSYFRKDGFLNKGYLIPFDEIVAYITANSRPDEASIVLDQYGTDAGPVLAQSPPSMPMIPLRDDAALQHVRQVASRSATQVIWFVRNTHDVSPGGLNAGVEAELSQRYYAHRHFFVAYSRLDQAIMRLLGWSERPHHVIELLEMRRKD